MTATSQEISTCTHCEQLRRCTCAVERCFMSATGRPYGPAVLYRHGHLWQTQEEQAFTACTKYPSFSCETLGGLTAAAHIRLLPAAAWPCLTPLPSVCSLQGRPPLHPTTALEYSYNYHACPTKTLIPRQHRAQCKGPTLQRAPAMRGACTTHCRQHER